MALKLKKSLKLKQFLASVVDESTELIRNLKNWEELKYDHQLIKSIAQLLEAKILEQNISEKKLDKQALLIEILKIAFELTDEQTQAINEAVSYMIDNKQILNWTIKKSSKSFLSKLLKKLKIKLL